MLESTAAVPFAASIASPHASDEFAASAYIECNPRGMVAGAYARASSVIVEACGPSVERCTRHKTQRSSQDTALLIAISRGAGHLQQQQERALLNGVIARAQHAAIVLV